MVRLERVRTLALASALPVLLLVLPLSRGKAQPVRLDRPAVLFLVPAAEPETQTQLREALLAQFASLEADLLFAPVTEAQGTLSQRVAQAQAFSTRHPLLVAFWIEEQPDSRWHVHMMDMQSERVVVRQVEAQPERRQAAIEAVAVMARESTRALIEGEPPPASEVTLALPPKNVPEKNKPPAAPPTEALAPAVAGPTPEAAARKAEPPSTEEKSKPAADEARSPSRSGPKSLRLWVSYTGQDFAPQTSFNHGASFGAAWLGFAPIYAGVAYLWTPKQALKQPLAFDIQRFPASAYAGYRFVQGIFRIDTELGVTVEWLHRSAATEPGIATVPPSAVEPGGPSTRIVVGLAPRLAGEVQPLPYLGLFAALGFDTLLTDFKYIEEKPQGSQTLLAPNRVRTVAMAGVAFYPY